MKFKHHVSISDENEDPLKNEKRSLDKALMTGQQKVERILCTLQTHFTLNKKEKKKGTLMRKTGFNNHQRGQKASKRDYIYKKTTFMDKRKMSKQTNDLSQPFQERKRHRGKEKNH